MKTNKWKMALLVWLAMFPYSTAVHYGLAQLPFTADWPLFVRTFCLTCMLVPYMVFIALPFLNRRFQQWLQQQQRAEKEAELLVSKQSEANAKRLQKPYPRLLTNGATM